MYNPVSTYRFQFNETFTLAHLDALLPYLHELGVTTVYASPVFAATPQSPHGYDGVDANQINPEIGTEEQLRAIGSRLRELNMGWIQDIVPNHMAYHIDTIWLTDVLENGSSSRYATFFDTSFSSSFFEGPVTAPFLPESLEETIAQGKLTVGYVANRLVFEVNGNTLPLRPGSYVDVLRSTDAVNASPDASIRQLLDQLDQLHHLDEPTVFAPAWDEWRQQLAALLETPATQTYLTERLAALNNSPALLFRLADEQHYRFCVETDTHRAITYRRFFNINGLICLAMQHPTVFDHYHRLTSTLINEGIFQGLRIDHLDGLFDPTQYLQQLRTLTGPDTYIAVEKILQATETLPASWASDTCAVAGTSGYDFLATVNNLLTDSRSEAPFRDYYNTLIESSTSLTNRIRYRKAYFLAQFMGGELDNLHRYFIALGLTDADTLAELPTGTLRLAIAELLIGCPVYRYYSTQFPLPAAEAEQLQTLLTRTRTEKPDLSAAVSVLETALLTRSHTAGDDHNHRAGRFYLRLMQFTGPLMAKGVEDTLLYTYNCFVGHNEVGDSPERFGMSVSAFHTQMQDRQQHWPLAMNTTATHDTKRGEDVRARLNILTTLPDEWLAEVEQWRHLNETDEPGLDANDAYFIYQNLLGAYPMPSVDAPRVDAPEEHDDNFRERFQDYLHKALQEAKRHTTGWEVDETYRADVQAFIDRLLDTRRPFWEQFRSFHYVIADFGITNSLVQVLLKFTCPGVPDIYQGGESWDLSLVDPDNRRPVDFEQRQHWLTDLADQRQSGDATSLRAERWQNRFDGRVKAWLTRSLLHERRQNATLFAEGDYVPLSVEGAYRHHVLAFARRRAGVWYVVVVPLHTASLCRQQQTDIRSLNWHATSIALLPDMPSVWTNCLTDETGHRQDVLPLDGLFAEQPVVLLRYENNVV